MLKRLQFVCKVLLTQVVLAVFLFMLLIAVEAGGVGHSATDGTYVPTPVEAALHIALEISIAPSIMLYKVLPDSLIDSVPNDLLILFAANAFLTGLLLFCMLAVLDRFYFHR